MRPAPGKITQSLFYLSSFAIYYLITLLITRLPDVTALRVNGLLVPVLCLFEFAVLYPIYRFYRTRYNDIPTGRLRLKPTLVFIGLLLLMMVVQSKFMQPEQWLENQAQSTRYSVLILLFSATILAPVFEEILFRGFLLQGFLLWVPQRRFACMLLTSLLFSAMHTQYLHWQTFVILTLFSLLLCYARLRSNSLALPIFLHMINNLIALLPALYYVWRV